MDKSRRNTVDMKKLALILLLTVGALMAHGQDVQQSLAIQFYQNGEYAKAADLFAKLYEKNPTDTNYHYLYNTYMQLKEFDKMEKILKKSIKRNPGNLVFVIDYGNLLKQKGDEKGAQDQFEKAIKQLAPDDGMIRALAGEFEQVGEPEMAIRTYLHGQELAQSKVTYSLELADLYGKLGKKKEAIAAYVDYYEGNPADQQSVKNHLQDAMQDDAYFSELQGVLLNRIQKSPEDNTIVDLLIWAYLQKSDYHNAFIQARALDKRNKENGFRVFNLARVALENKAYDAAIESYQYVLDKGKSTSLYLPAMQEILKARKEKITHDYSYTQGSIDTLLIQYNQFIDEYGVNQTTFSTMLEKAELEAFYLHNYDSAIAIVEGVVKLPQIDRTTKAMAKLDLGDYYLLRGEDWEASLTYSQVDKEMKEDPLGELARFKNAKLSYYQGDFDWSQAQLQILKASTTELIANDALQLSVFMLDNLGLDTTQLPMQMYARADLDVYQNKLDQALKTLDSITAIYPTHALADDILYEKAQISLKRKDFTGAVTYLQQVIDNYGKDILADDATFTLADLYEHQLNDKQKAMDLYKSIILNYKDSIYVVEARKRFRQLRGDEVN